MRFCNQSGPARVPAWFLGHSDWGFKMITVSIIENGPDRLPSLRADLSKDPLYFRTRSNYFVLHLEEPLSFCYRDTGSVVGI